MVARGDLGVELPLEQVPMAQKRIVEQARAQAKPVIVATQMLESMISAPRPTRAEASDVANAVLDGADALMLSAETSVGEYPVQAVATMSRIISEAERESMSAASVLAGEPGSTGGAIARAAAEVGAAVGAKALVAFTMTGETARRLARYRTPIPLLAFTPQPSTRSQLALSWGVETFIVPPARHTDAMVRQVEEALLEIGRCDKGDMVVIVAGSPPGTPGADQRPAGAPHRRRRGPGSRSRMTGTRWLTWGAPGGIRTHTAWFLRPWTLPVGLPGRCGQAVRSWLGRTSIYLVPVRSWA